MGGSDTVTCHMKSGVSDKGWCLTLVLVSDPRSRFGPVVFKRHPARNASQSGPFRAASGSKRCSVRLFLSRLRPNTLVGPAIFDRHPDKNAGRSGHFRASSGLKCCSVRLFSNVIRFKMLVGPVDLTRVVRFCSFIVPVFMRDMLPRPDRPR